MANFLCTREQVKRGAGIDGDERNAVITWQPVRGVVGYNVRWGISSSKLYQTYQRFADRGTTLELRALTVGQAYWADRELRRERCFDPELGSADSSLGLEVILFLAILGTLLPAVP